MYYTEHKPKTKTVGARSENETEAAVCSQLKGKHEQDVVGKQMKVLGIPFYWSRLQFRELDQGTRHGNILGTLLISKMGRMRLCT